jgi:hypothetical protein
MMWRSPCLVPAFAIIAAWIAPVRADFPAEVSDAIAWYDSQGYPNAKDLPYVRVATGRPTVEGDKPPAETFLEGFLVREEGDSFNVFVCSRIAFKNTGATKWSPRRNYGVFTRANPGPAYKRVDFEPLDFEKAVSDVLEKARAPQSAGAHARLPAFERLRIFLYARACLQRDLSEKGSALMDIARIMPDEKTGEPDQRPLRDKLQEEVGDLVLAKAEFDWSVPSRTWNVILKQYEQFDTRYPASTKLAHALESAELVRKMIAEEAAHHPKPLDQMTHDEQVAEDIYQLRYLSMSIWSTMNGRPLKLIFVRGAKAEAPVQRLLDLGLEAVPQLIEALDDRRFTRSKGPTLSGAMGPSVVRVGDYAREILANLACREFSGNPAEVRHQAEAWWEEAKKKGEKQMLIDVVATGGRLGLDAARRLAEKYPDSAIDAINAGVRATKEKSSRGEFVELAGSLPGKASLAFLKLMLGAGNGIPAQVTAARALTARGEPGVVPVMIKAWHSAQPRLAADEPAIYQQAGRLIAFLAKSGNPEAIDALGQAMRKTPIDERLAIVQVFQPPGTNSSSFAVGNHSPNFPLELADHFPGKAGSAVNPPGKAGHAIESLLISALGDAERRFQMKGTFNQSSYEDPRICDFAAAVLSARWPAKYQFRWSADAKECDAQISILRDKWRSEGATPRIHL